MSIRCGRFVISDNRAVYLRSEKLFPNLRVHIVKQREEPDRYFTGAHSTHSHTGPNAMCDIVIRRDVSTSDLAYLLSTSLRWQHNGTGFQVPVRRVRRITVDPGAAVTEACSPQKSQDFKLDGFANTFMFHYRDERASERLSRTMIILDRLFVRKSPQFGCQIGFISSDIRPRGVGDSSHKTHVALEDGTAIFDTYLNTVCRRTRDSGLSKLTTVDAIFRFETGSNEAYWPISRSHFPSGSALAAIATKSASPSSKAAPKRSPGSINGIGAPCPSTQRNRHRPARPLPQSVKSINPTLFCQ
jgi:hypothetical protein